jgi:hypothetical protein
MLQGLAVYVSPFSRYRSGSWRSNVDSPQIVPVAWVLIFEEWAEKFASLDAGSLPGPEPPVRNMSMKMRHLYV